MCKKYKILNLTTGRCFNNNLPDFQHDLPEIVYEDMFDADLNRRRIIALNALLSNHNVKPYHLEVIEIEVQDS